MPFHIDRAIRTRWTKVLASTTANTSFRIDHRDLQRLRICRIFRHHLDRFCRAMTFTITTTHAVRIDNTKIFHPYSMPDLNSGLIFFRNRLDRPCRADLRAFRTFRTTITSIECHLRLHQFHQIRRRTQDMILADRYTKLTPRAML